MANATRTVTIKIDADGNAYVSEIGRLTEANAKFSRDAQAGAEQTISAFTRLGASIITFNQALELAQKALTAIKSAFSALIDAASDQQDAQNKLAAALQLTGRQIPIERFTDFASAIQKTTRFNDEAVLSSIALLTSLTALDEKGLQRAVRGAIGLAAVLDKDLPAATLAVGRALNGNAQGLQRVGIQIDATLPLQKQQQQVLEKLSVLYGRAEADSRTYAGATAQLKNAFADLLEEVGTPLINGLTGVAQQITPILQSTLEWATKNRDLVVTILSLIGAIGAGLAAAGLVGSIGFLITNIGVLGTAIGALITNPIGLAALLALIGVGAAAFLLMKNRIQEFTETLTKAGAEQGLKRLNDELQRLQQLQSADVAKRDPRLKQLGLEGGIAQRQAEIDALNKQITERQTLVKQFESQEIKGGQLPQIVDKNTEDQALKNAQAIAELKKQIDQAQLSVLQASEGTERYSQAQHDAALAALDAEQAEKIAAATKDKTIAATRIYIDQLYEAKRALFEANEKNKDTARYIEDANRALETEAEDAKIAAEAGDLHAKSVNNVIQRLLEQIDIEHQLGDLEAEKLAAVGRTAEAEKLRFENQIKNLQALKAYEVANAKDEQAKLDAIRLRDSQIDLAQTQLQQLGVASVNVGHAIADTLNDIFTAAIQGTLKFSDIGKSLLAGVARTAGDFFTQILNKKLGFENIIIDNMHGLPGQIFQAFGLGAAALPGGQAGGGGGLLNLLLGGGGSSPGVFSSFPGASGNVVPDNIDNFTFGSSGVGNGGTGTPFSGGLGGALLGGGIGILTALLSGGFKKGQIGSTIGGIGGGIAGGIAGSFFGPIGTLLGGALGSILGKLLGGLFNQIPNPTVWVKSILKFYYDALTDSFGFFNTSTITKIKDISGGKAQEVLAQHQEILKGLGDKFVDLLNVFPSQFHDIIAAQLDDANRVLNDIFGFKKYTEGGSRNIQKELDDLKNKEGPLGFFVALRGALGTGLAATLRQSGFNFDNIIGQQFPFPPNPTPRDFPFRGGVPGLLPPEGADNFDKFIDALNKFVSFTGTLSAISPRGIAPFVTGLDQERLQAEIQKVLESPGEGFADAVDKMLQRVQPLTDFLKQSVSEATDLFGRGLMAALDAATASEANAAFLKNIGEGVKDKIFSGITEAFIASAQFTDLLAPIQQIIRQFTQDALASGQTPDIGAFRAALLPAIEDISTRAESLRPLIEALQALGFDVTHALESLIGSGTVGGGNNVTINIENFNREDDPQVLAQRIQDLLNGRTAP